MFAAGELNADQIPSEVEVLHVGKFNHPVHGEFEVTQAHLDEIVAEFKRDPEALVDVDHKAARGDTRAAGWVKGLRADSGVLHAQTDWTDYGNGLLSKKEYRRVSAEFGPRRDPSTGKMGALHLKAFTLTNRPFLRGLKPITLNDGTAEIMLDTMEPCPAHDAYQADCADCKALNLSETPADPSVGDGADPTNQTGTGAMTDQIRSALSLADTATDADILAAITALQAPPASDVVSLSDFEAVKTLAETATAAADKATKELGDFQRDTYLSEQVRNGRILASEVDQFVELYNVAPAQTRALIEVKPSGHHLTTIGHSGSADTALTGESIYLPAADGRSNMDAEAKKLMSATPGLSYGDACIMVEKAAT